MSMIVAPSENYNSFVSLEDAESYHLDRNTAAWLQSPSEYKEPALIRATDYVLANYTFSVGPVAIIDGQTVVISAVKKAVSALAVTGLTDTLAETRETRETKSTLEKLEGVGEVRTEYETGRIDPFPFVTKLLAGVATINGPTKGIVVGTVVK